MRRLLLLLSLFLMAPSPLPSGYFSVSGNQFQDGLGNNVRLACTSFRGTPGDGTMPAIRSAGFNCIRLDWRDAYLSGTQTAAFDDEFSSAPWLTHRSWQSGDMWGYGPTFGTDGIGEAPTTWWTNPIATPAGASLYSNVDPTGQLRLGLMQNPSNSGVTGNSCNFGNTPCASLGTIIQNQNLPGGNNQLYGYYEFSVAVQKVNGFQFHWDVEDYPLNAAWTMEIDVDIWTNSSGTSNIRFSDPIHSNNIYTTSAYDITQQHVYGVNWQSDFLTFYIDNVQVAQAPNPGGDFQSKSGFSYLLTTDSNYIDGGTTPFFVGTGGGTILTNGQNLSQTYLNNLATAVHNEQEAEVPGGECFTGTCIYQNYLQGDTILPLQANVALVGDIGSLTDKDGNIWTLEGSPPCGGGPNWWFGGIKVNGSELFCGYVIAIRLLDNGEVYVEEAKGGGWWSLTQYCEAGCSGSNRPGEGPDPGPGPNNRSSSSPTEAFANVNYFRVYPNKSGGVTAPAGCNSLTQMDTCVANATSAGLKVIFNHAGNEAPVGAANPCWGRQANGLWFDSGGSSGNDDGCGDGGNITYNAFKTNTVNLLGHFANNPTVIGYDFHNEPLINGSFTGTGTTGAGTFNINLDGSMTGPDGKVYRSYGVNVDDTTFATAQAADIKRLLPKMNTIRLAVGAASCSTGGYACSGAASISAIETWTNSIIANNTVVMIESHNCNGVNAQANSIDLPSEYTWYNTLSNDYKAVPKGIYVWFEDGNECGHQGITRENRNVYNAVRGCPQAALTCDWLPSTSYSSGGTIYSKGNIYTAAGNCTSGTTAPSGATNQSDGGCSWNYSKQGNSTPVGFEISNSEGDGPPDGPASQYNSMSNIFWTPHIYNSNTGGDTNQTNVNNDFANWVTNDAAYTTQYGGGKIPGLFSEVGFIDYANKCGGPDGAFNQLSTYNPYNCGSAQVVTAALTPTTTLELGTTIWTWHFDGCCEWQTDTVDRNSNPLGLLTPYGPIVANLIATNSPGQAASTGTSGNPPVGWGNGGDTDIMAACGDVGAAVYAVNKGVIEFCPGPLNNGTTLLNGAAKP